MNVDLVNRLVLSMVQERSREPGDAWDQAYTTLREMIATLKARETEPSAAEVARRLTKAQQREEIDHYDFDDDGECWECGGEGYVSSCFSEYACLYPEDGCDLCTRRCDVCSPRQHLTSKDNVND